MLINPYFDGEVSAVNRKRNHSQLATIDIDETKHTFLAKEDEKLVLLTKKEKFFEGNQREFGIYWERTPVIA